MAKHLRDKGLQFYPTLRDANRLKSVAVRAVGKEGPFWIRVKHVSKDAALLATICQLMVEQYKQPFPYHGEDWGSLAVRIAEFFVCQHRPKSIDREAYEADECYICGDPLDGKVELRHELQPMRGGHPKSPDNVKPITPTATPGSPASRRWASTPRAASASTPSAPRRRPPSGRRRRSRGSGTGATAPETPTGGGRSSYAPTSRAAAPTPY